jgi:hypothetical protein
MSIYVTKLPYTEKNQIKIEKTQTKYRQDIIDKDIKWEKRSEGNPFTQPARFFACTGIYEDALYMYGGTYIHSDHYHDLWRV